MLRIRGSLLVALSLTVVGGTSPLEAQVIPSPYDFIDTRQEFGIFAGHMESDRGRFSLGPDAGVAYGARYSIKLGGGPLAFEAIGFGLPTTRHIVDPREDEADQVLQDVDSFVLGADVRLRFSLTGPRTWRNFSPYGSVGLGAAIDARSVDVEDLPIEAELDFRFGPAFMGVGAAGVRWLPFERIGLRGETSLHFWRLGTPRGFAGLEDELGPIPEQEWVASPMFTLALTYRL